MIKRTFRLNGHFFAIISKENIFWRSFYLIFYKCPFYPLIVIIDRYNRYN